MPARSRAIDQIGRAKTYHSVTICAHALVLFNELSHLKGADCFFDNINTPEDYIRVKKKGLSIDDVAMG